MLVELRKKSLNILPGFNPKMFELDILMVSCKINPERFHDKDILDESLAHSCFVEFLLLLKVITDHFKSWLEEWL